MGNLVNYVTKLHQTTKRAYIDRMIDDKVNCMKKAKEYEFDYWDGNRRYGYGGYKYMPGRWKPVAELLIKNYNLTNNSQVLDVGCGKAFLLYEMKLLLPNLKISGFDISKHGLNSAKEEIKKNLFVHKAQDDYPFKDKQFNLVVSCYTLVNTVEITHICEKLLVYFLFIRFTLAYFYMYQSTYFLYLYVRVMYVVCFIILNNLLANF